MVAIENTAWFALMNWKTRMGSLQSPVRTRLPPLPGYHAPDVAAGSRDADVAVLRARRWSGHLAGGLRHDQPAEPSSRLLARSARTRAITLPAFAQTAPPHHLA